MCQSFCVKDCLGNKMSPCHIRFGKLTLNHKPYICQFYIPWENDYLPDYYCIHFILNVCIIFSGCQNVKVIDKTLVRKILWLFPRSDSAQYFPICIFFFLACVT